jgi:predicted ATPase/DNA-binding winged helix-turn-helix (wHTH) protein
MALVEAEMSLQLSSAIGERLRFGEFELSPAARTLWRGGEQVKLGSRALDILITLASRPGQILSKEDLTNFVWRGAVVDETALRVGISTVRKALGNDGDRCIVTVPGRGYCFVLDVETTAAKPAAAPVSLERLTPRRLPIQIARVVGREEVIARLAAEATSRRLVSVVGPGGIGKTTVAIAVADRLCATFDAVAFVDLAAIQNGTQTSATAATALGLNLRPREDPVDEIALAVGDRRVLIILDNCEHLVAFAAAFAEALLSSAPGITILTTTRERLRAAGEWVYRLSPLDAPSESSALSAEEARVYPAVEMFEERAASILGGYQVSDADAPYVAEICRRLDGIALAIELAAGRLLGFGVQGLAYALEDCFSVLTHGRRTALPRHQTLRATLDWSYGLLPREDQMALMCLSVFNGGFTPDDAAFVMAPSIPNGEANDRLISLVDKSLVVARTDEMVFRYCLLDTTRTYARERLAESGESLAIARRHATRFLALFEPAEVDWEHKPKARWLETYAVLINDLRAALGWAFGPEGDVSVGVSLTTASAPLWFALSLLNEYRDHAEHALEHIALSALSGSEVEMKLAVSLRMAVFNIEGPSPRLAMITARALQIAELRGDPDYQLRALWQLAGERYVQGDYHTALMFCERFERVADATRDEAVQVVRDRLMALALHLVGRQADARPYAERAVTYPASVSLSAHRTFNEFDNRVASRSHLARILWVQGFPDRAAAVSEEGVEQALLLGHPIAACYILAFAACPIAFWNGDAVAIERYMRLFDTQLTDVSLGYWQTWRRCYQQINVLGANDGTPEFARRVETLLKSAGGPMFIDILGAVREELAGPDANARAEGEQCGWCAAEVLRAKGANLLRRADRDAGEEAEVLFRRSLDLAARQSALSWELRGAMSLARLWRDRGHRQRAHGLLAPIYARFSEGFETVDLKVAKRLLRELANP